jgi:RNA polymerase sigma-70 factor (ECF subfamily)
MTSAPPFDRVVAEHLAMIRRIAGGYESNTTAREDLVQEILCAVWRALPAFRGDSTLRAFIARVAANRSVTHVQRAVRRPPSVELPDLAGSGPTPEAQAIASEQAARLLLGVRRLPIGLREPALLALEGLTSAEIAGVLGISANAAAVRLTRARNQLRRDLGE